MKLLRKKPLVRLVNYISELIKKVGGGKNEIMSLLKTSRTKNYSKLKHVKNMFDDQKEPR